MKCRRRDLLRRQLEAGIAYAKKESGYNPSAVPVMLVDEPTLTHGFLRAAPFSPRGRAVQQAFGRADANRMANNAHWYVPPRPARAHLVDACNV